ncbi:hypothetical protein TcWFU_003281 [Taenia crassiceps]|uniref:Uncharacterized protein n=1 Tax=Taenia crassiceps TaxID=6207 RepID=A0ABR4QGJ3_9CEST
MTPKEYETVHVALLHSPRLCSERIAILGASRAQVTSFLAPPCRCFEGVSTCEISEAESFYRPITQELRLRRYSGGLFTV